ncbi:MAG: TlyA family RNA methyltransferase [Pseudomonadota bacterium]
MPRVDRELVARGLVETRARAQALIAAGAVLIDDQIAAKPAQAVDSKSNLSITRNPLPYVSRAALKLRHALQTFGLTPVERVALDLGASTGGFTQVLLEEGAREVWAIDAGRDQLHPSLRDDPRVRAIEGLNARDLTADHVPQPDWVVADLSFISLEKALPPALSLAKTGATLVCLVKPQFEVGRDFVGKGGIVRDEAATSRALERIKAFLIASGWRGLGDCESPIRGGDGNREFLIAAQKMTQHSA